MTAPHPAPSRSGTRVRAAARSCHGTESPTDPCRETCPSTLNVTVKNRSIYNTLTGGPIPIPATTRRGNSDLRKITRNLSLTFAAFGETGRLR